MNLGHATYLVWLLGCSLPILLGQWAAFGRRIRSQLRATLLAPLIVGTYLSLADQYAIGNGIWRFSPELISGFRIGRVPIEEVLFFYITSLLVTQSLALFTKDARERREGQP